MTSTFYARGTFPRLRECWRFLRGQGIPVTLSRARREDLFDGLAVATDTAVFTPPIPPHANSVP